MNTYQILIDEKYSRLLCVGVSIHVFDLKTMRKITRIGGFSYLSYASIDYPGDKLYALNTVGDLKVFNLKIEATCEASLPSDIPEASTTYHFLSTELPFAIKVFIVNLQKS